MKNYLIYLKLLLIIILSLISVACQSSKNSSKHIAKAEKYYQAGDISKAIAEYDKAIEINPDLSLNYYNRGIYKTELGDYAGAISDYSKAIQLNPHMIEAYLNRANMLADFEYLEDAILDLEKATDINPQMYEAYLLMAEIKIELGEYTSAENDIKMALSINPDIWQPYFIYALLHYNTKEYSKALDNINLAINLNNDYDELYLMRASLLTFLESYNLAIDDHTRLISRGFEVSESYLARAQINIMIGDTAAGIADLNSVLQLDPEYSDIYNILGNIYLDKMEFDKADSCFSKAIETDEFSVDAYLGKGVLKFHKATNLNLISVRDSVIRPIFIMTIIKKAFDVSNTPLMLEAIDYYNKAIEIEPLYAEPYRSRGLAYFLLEEYEKSISDYNFLLNNGINDDFTYIILSHLYYYQGNYSKAIEIVDLLLKQNPTYNDMKVFRERIKNLTEENPDGNTSPNYPGQHQHKLPQNFENKNLEDFKKKKYEEQIEEGN